MLLLLSRLTSSSLSPLASWFLNTGFWDLLFFVLMAVISFMWRPSLANEHNFREENLVVPPGGAPGTERQRRERRRERC
jgi:hypothetical protein